jgi:signal transduction histidine kinase
MRRLLKGFYAQLLLVTVLPLTLVLSAVSFGALAMHQESMRGLVAERDMRAVMTTARVVGDLLAGCGEQPNGAKTTTKPISSATVPNCVSSAGLDALINPMAGHRRAIAYVFDRNGVVIVHTDASQIGAHLGAHAGVAEAISGRHGTVYQDDPLTHSEHVVSYAALELPAGSEPFGLIIEEPWAEVIDPVMRMSMAAPLVLLPVTLLAAIAITLGLRRIVRPLQQLRASVQLVDGEDFSALTHVPTRGAIQEIRDLSTTLDRMATRIQEDQQTLRMHTQAVMRAQESERARLAHDLHDGTIQNLIALAQRIQLLKATVPVPTAAQDRLDALLEHAQFMIEDVRRISQGLRPTYLEEAGLVSALERLTWQADELSAQQTPPVRISFECSGDIPRLSADVELALFRITQEAINNALRHAGARQVTVSLTASSQVLSLTISDDGSGFSPSLLNKPDGLGLFGIRERAKSIGAHHDVASAPGQGVRITVTITLNGRTRP